MYADAPSDQIDMLVAKKVDGIVIAGVGNGNFNKAFMDAVKKAVAACVFVCRASRSPSGRVVLHDEINDDVLGTIVSDDLNPQKARILLYCPPGQLAFLHKVSSPGIFYHYLEYVPQTMIRRKSYHPL